MTFFISASLKMFRGFTITFKKHKNHMDDIALKVSFLLSIIYCHLETGWWTFCSNEIWHQAEGFVIKVVKDKCSPKLPLGVSSFSVHDMVHTQLIPSKQRKKNNKKLYLICFSSEANLVCGHIFSSLCLLGPLKHNLSSNWKVLKYKI